MRLDWTQLAGVAMVSLVASCAHRQAAAPQPAAAPARPKAVSKPATPKAGIVSSISLTNLVELQQSGRVLIIDARPGFVHAFGHLPGAVSWPRGLFESELPQHQLQLKQAAESDRTIVVYCTDAACPDAGVVARRISALGYPVSVLEGGFAAWKEADLPVE